MLFENLKKPFGEVSCELEVGKLKEDYSKFFFSNAPFNDEVLDIDTYLVVGRRGSGKTSLTQYFTFQKRYSDCICIDVNEPVEYQDVLAKVSLNASVSDELRQRRLERIWDHIFFSLIFENLKDEKPEIRNAALIGSNDSSSIAHFVKNILKAILKAITSSEDIGDNLEDILENDIFKKAKTKVLEYAENRPIFIAIDSLERYDIDNLELMDATAALITAAKKFNSNYSDRNLFLKVFISAEIYPYIKEQFISNPIKYISNPVFLHWNPKDLVRLISWRLIKKIDSLGRRIPAEIESIDWNNFDEVFDNVWKPYFGDKLYSRPNHQEEVYPYIMRHTQMRPRQVIKICNKIAKVAGYNIPSRDPSNIIPKAIYEEESELADGVISIYNKIYYGASEILGALTEIPMRFEGKLLDKIAYRTTSKWLNDYSPTRFKRLLAELGIVGKVRSADDRSRKISADFEYNLSDRLILTEKSDCVVHPMFYRKFRINTSDRWIVYPFPDHIDYKKLNGI